MEIVIKICDRCRKSVKNLSSAKDIFYAGMVITTNEDDNTKCEECGNALHTIDMTLPDIMVFATEYNFNRQLLDEMIELKQKDIIEYELKMAQFRNQAEQKNIIDSKKSDDNTPKCPTCGSTNIKKISTTAKMTNTMLFGIFGNKRKKQFYCESCGYEW